MRRLVDFYDDPGAEGATVRAVRTGPGALVGALICVLIGVPSGATAVTGGVVFGGRTSQLLPMFVRTNSTGTKVAVMSWRWNATCVNGPAAPSGTYARRFYSELPWRNIPVSGAGRWRIHEVQRFPYAGLRNTVTYNLTGRRTGNFMEGTIQIVEVERNDAGELFATCRTPRVTFRLPNARRFGGLTSQTRMAVLTLSEDQRTITRFEWRWISSSCTLGPAADASTDTFVYIDEVLRDIGATGKGVWKGTYRFPSRTSGGIRRSWSYPLDIRRQGSFLRGTIRAVYVEQQPSSGALIRRCISGPVTFKLAD